ncbi:MAG: hypothetical protein IPI44_18910 [Sulfuritalea sp.]|nr:hypothetical protein [Sulfuritalea sp.]
MFSSKAIERNGGGAGIRECRETTTTRGVAGTIETSDWRGRSGDRRTASPGLPTLVDENIRLNQIVRAMLWDSLPIVTAVRRGGDGPLNKPCLSTMELSVNDLLRFADRFQEIQKEHLSSNKGLISLLVGYPTCSVGERAP